MRPSILHALRQEREGPEGSGVSVYRPTVLPQGLSPVGKGTSCHDFNQHHLETRHSPLENIQPMTINGPRPPRSSASLETHASNPRPLPSIPGSAGVCAPLTNGASPSNTGETASSQPRSSLAIAPSDEPMTQTSRSVNLRRATRSTPDHGSFDEFDLVERLDRSMSLDLGREPRASGGEVRPVTSNATATVEVQAPGVAERVYPESYRSSWLLPSASSNARPPPPVNQLPSPPEIIPSYNTTRRRLDPSYVYEERPAPHQRIPESPTSAVPQIQRIPPSPPRITSPVVCNNGSSRADLRSPYGARPAPGQRTPDPATSAVPQSQWMPPSPPSTTSSGNYPNTRRRLGSPNVYGVRPGPGQRTPDPSTSAVPQSQRMSPSPSATTSSGSYNNTYSRLDSPNVYGARPAPGQRIPDPSPSAVPQDQRMTSAGPSTFEPRVFYPPNPTPQTPHSRWAPRPQLNFQPPVPEDRRTEVSRLRVGLGSGGSSPTDPYLEYPQVREGDSSRVVELPLRSKDIRRGYYRLYTAGGTLFSVKPIYSNDISLSSFDVEHVSPPRQARNYIALISQREYIRPSGVKMYLTRPGVNPELVKNLDKVIVMAPSRRLCGRSRDMPLLFVVDANGQLPDRHYPFKNTIKSLPYRDFDDELQYVYYRLFGAAASSKGRHQLMWSRHPLYQNDRSLTTFFICKVSPTLRVKDYIAHISDKEGIHPSRITLFLRRAESQRVGYVAAEAQEITDVDDILTVKTALSCSERKPILVNVELEVDEHGKLLFETKNTPLVRFSIQAITRNVNRALPRWAKGTIMY